MIFVESIVGLIILAALANASSDTTVIKGQAFKAFDNETILSFLGFCLDVQGCPTFLKHERKNIKVLLARSSKRSAKNLFALSFLFKLKTQKDNIFNKVKNIHNPARFFDSSITSKTTSKSKNQRDQLFRSRYRRFR